MQVPFFSAARMRMSQVPLGRMPPIVCASLSFLCSAPIKYIFAPVVEWKVRVWPTRIIVRIISRLLIAAEKKFQRRRIIWKIQPKHNLQISPGEVLKNRLMLFKFFLLCWRECLCCSLITWPLISQSAAFYFILYAVRAYRRGCFWSFFMKKWSSLKETSAHSALKWY